MLSGGEPEDIGAAIRAARVASGRTQAELANAADVGRQWLVAVERGHARAEIGLLLRVLHAVGLDVLLEIGASTSAGPSAPPPRLTAADAARAIREELGRGDRDFALRLLARMVADFRAVVGTDDTTAFLSAPPSTGDRRWDTLLAAVVARECRRRQVPAPSWTNVPALAAWWFPDDDPVLMARTMQRTPVDLQVKGIWLDGKALESL